MNEKSQKIPYDKKEVEEATLEYFDGDQLATDIWINKYCLKDLAGNLLEKTPDDMHWRLANEIARVEKKYPNPLSENDIYDTLKNFKRIIPQGSPMFGIGNYFRIVSISNCFVIGEEKPADSYGGIMKTDQEQVQLMKRRGGVGHDLSHIRPKGAHVLNSALTSTGIVPFMERFSNSTIETAQGGRRGALMLSISIKHPDAEDFIDAKLEKGKVTGANISAKIDDEFMYAVTNNDDYIQSYPVDLDFNLDSGIRVIDMEYNKLYKGILGYYKKIKARILWEKITYNAWKSAEPGILFWDNIINESIPDCYANLGFKTISTNPCGEIPLCANDSCRLLLLNLYGYVVNPFTSESYINYTLFENDVIIAQKYMDDIVDLEIEKIDSILNKIKNDPEDEFIKQYELNLWKRIREMAIAGRRTGLGVTGEGDMLAALGFIYGTDKATEISENIHMRLKHKAYESSIMMARDRGSFPIYNSDLEKNNPFILRLKNENPELYDKMINYGRRNIALLTIAPAGTTSLMTQTTSGIESCFLPTYKRRRKINPNDKTIKVDFVDDGGISWAEYIVFHHNFKTWLIANDYNVNVVKTMNEDQIEEIVKKSPYHKATANDINWVKKVEMQGKIQKHVDHSISVTVNLPETAPKELVDEIYKTGWKSGCKGITIYREGSRDGVLINVSEKKENFNDNHAPKRPKRLRADIIRFQNNLEKWIAVVGLLNDRPYEMFIGQLTNGLSNLPSTITQCEVIKVIVDDEHGDKTKRYDIEYVDNNGNKQTHTGLSHSFNPEYWNYAKLISGVLRHGMPLSNVYELVRSLNLNDEHLNTWKAGIERVIKKYVKDGERVKGVCENCGSEYLEFSEGCLLCKNCGSSKCS